MNREILFRGKRVDNGELVFEGDRDKSGNTVMYITEKALFALVNDRFVSQMYPFFGNEIEVIGTIHDVVNENCNRCNKKPKYDDSIYCLDCAYAKKMEGL